MTVWRARLAKPRQDRDDDDLLRRNIGGRILCGWHVGSDYCAAPPIAYLTYEFDAVTLPRGLTDEGTPGMFRWSQSHRRRESAGRPNPAAPADLSYGRRGNVTLPIRVPCRKNHDNIVDAGVAFP